MTTDGTYTAHIGHYRIQLYWPEITLTSINCYVVACTAARVSNMPHIPYWGIGLQVLGFGAAIDWRGET